jgi:alpha-beta hydrolase superfamily lysophospholipase
MGIGGALEIAAKPDVLGAEYESITLPLRPDDEGDVVATLVRRCGGRLTRRAVLSVHGCHDYFFATELADWYAARGFSFYALDMRKCGRSIRPWQTPGFCRSLSEYAEELDLAVKVIKDIDGHDTLLLNAQAAGGLAAALFCDARRHRALVDALVLGSPFLDLRVPWPVRAAAAPLIGAVARGRPRTCLPARSLGRPARSLHRAHQGEWDLNPRWKPLGPWPVHAAWLAATLRAQRRLRRGIDVGCPALVLCPAESGSARLRDATGRSAGSAADVARWAPRLGPRVTCLRIEGAVHDLMLSPRPVRKLVCDELGRWLGAYLSGQVRDRLL